MAKNLSLVGYFDKNFIFLQPKILINNEGYRTKP